MTVVKALLPSPWLLLASAVYNCWSQNQAFMFSRLVDAAFASLNSHHCKQCSFRYVPPREVTHTHTNTHTQASNHAYTCTQRHTCTHTPVDPHPHMRNHTDRHTYKYTHTRLWACVFCNTALSLAVSLFTAFPSGTLTCDLFAWKGGYRLFAAWQSGWEFLERTGLTNTNIKPSEAEQTRHFLPKSFTEDAMGWMLLILVCTKQAK